MPDALIARSAVVAVTDRAAELEPPAAEWEALIDDRAPGAVFTSPTWLASWWSAFSSSRRLRIATVRHGGALTAALAAYRVRDRFGVTSLRLIGDGMVGSDHLGLVVRAGHGAAAAAALAHRLLEDEEQLILYGMSEGDPLLAALVAGARARGLAWSLEPLLPCPYLDVASAGRFDRWLAALPAGAGAQLERRRRWLARRPGFRLDVAEGEAAVAAALETLFALHAARWAEAGGSDGIAGESVRRFHRAAAPALARRGQARIYVLHADGAPRAALYGLARGPRFSFYQSGLDPSWRARSVGTVVLCAAIEDTFRRGLAEFDFLRGGERYKSTYASSARRVMRLRIARTPRARTAMALDALAARARAAAGALLGAAAVERYRRARRRRVEEP